MASLPGTEHRRSTGLQVWRLVAKASRPAGAPSAPELPVANPCRPDDESLATEWRGSRCARDVSGFAGNTFARCPELRRIRGEAVARSESFEKAQRRVKATLGRNVRELRLSLGLSQADLADRAETRRALISDVERGETNATLDSVVRIALVLGVHPHELLKPRPKSESAG
ncbi:helix-turn-helix domain-containing protein [Bradyrhizobium sp. McL0615]|uniref:helix-turn-helix domain-containing protein n=1 Tax=Bradyrhizobium sp. McL0615 TaxID=3415673 RepID=UPI003CF452F9